MSVSDHHRWLAYAHSDLDAAKALLANPEHYPRQVCYLAQQAAEKALKAALMREQIDFHFHTISTG